MDKQAVTEIRDDILEAALPHVAFDGWRWDGIEQAAAEKGYEHSMAQAVFPGKMKDVLEAFSDKADREMLEALKETDPESLKVRERVREALLKRFELLQPHKDAVRQSVLFWAVPTRKPRAGKIVWRTADRIWDWAGDTATDYNRYTKRGLLSGIIVSTTLAWLDDADPQMKRTQDFLDRRIDNVMVVGGWMRKILPGKEAA